MLFYLIAFTFSNFLSMQKALFQKLLLKSELPTDCAFLSLDLRRIRRGLTHIHRIVHRILEVKFATWDRSGLCYRALKNHQQWRNTRRRQHAFSGCVVPYWE